MKQSHKLFATLAALSALLVGEQQAVGLTASVKAMGMGGVATALPQDSLTTIYNPATASVLGNRWDIGLTYAEYHKSLNVNESTGDLFPVNQFQRCRMCSLLPDMGVNARVSSCWSFGLALYNHTYISTRYKQSVPLYQPFLPFGPVSFDYHVGALTASAAYNVNRCHSFGIAVNLYFSRFKLNGFALAQRGFFFLGTIISTASAPDFSTNKDYDYATGVGATLGYFGRWAKDLYVGASISSPATMSPFKQYRGFLANHRLDIPLTWRVGLAWDATCCLTLAADFEMRHYNGLRSWHNAYWGDFTEPIFGEAPSLFGNLNGPGFGWRCQAIGKVGISYKFHPCLTWRIGYRYENGLFNNGQSQTVLNGLPNEVTTNYLSTGATWLISPCAEFSFFTEWGLRGNLNSRTPLITDIALGVPIPLVTARPMQYKRSSWSLGLSLGYNY